MNQTVDIPRNRTREVYDLQRAAYLKNLYPSYQERYQNLLKLENILRDNQEAIAEAINRDFGNRSVYETKVLELFASIDGLKYCRRKLKKWLKARKRHVSIWFAGAKNIVLPQPKGIVGIVVPWNYPLFLSMGPLANALAAGNRCMVKMAANSQNLCRLLAKLVNEQISEETLAIMPGISASEFTAQPYDHLVFTGSAGVGKIVMKTAAEHLTPVTLELGGKSPTIVADDFDIKEAAARIFQGKLYNAGQTCVAPDYLFVAAGKVDAFIEHAKQLVLRRYPKLESRDYTAIIDSRAYARLMQTLDDARQKGAKLINLLGDQQPSDKLQKIPPYIVVDVNQDMTLMQEEIFGPILPIKPYKDIVEVLAYINAHERPLALYLFTNDRKLQERVLKNTISGGVCLNDVLYHSVQHDMPFGGIGHSGMGHYHGYEGFVEFSKLRPIFRQGKIPGTKFLAPPYGKLANFLIRMMTR